MVRTIADAMISSYVTSDETFWYYQQDNLGIQIC